MGGIFSCYPELVLQLSAPADLAGINPFNIGGVNDAGTSITHVITYKTPYTMNDKESALTMVLGSDIAANSNFGFPFLKAIKASLLFESDSLLSGLFVYGF